MRICSVYSAVVAFPPKSPVICVPSAIVCGIKGDDE